MKCPKCGFVSYPGLPECKKCGYRFEKAAAKESSSFLSGLFSAKSSPQEPKPPSSADITLDLEEPGPAAGSAGETSMAAAQPAGGGTDTAPPQPELFVEPEDAAPESDWREELSSRVEKFRQRRARLRGESNESLDFDFDKAELPEGAPEIDDQVIKLAGEKAPVESDLDRGIAEEPPLLDSLPLEKLEGSLSGAVPAAAEPGDYTLEPGLPEVEPMEILVPTSGGLEAEATSEAGAPVFPLAPLGRRLVAGLADAAVLMVAAGLFTLIFWRAGGHLSPQPLNIAVLAFIAVFFLVVYFGLFTALSSSTPGLLWMGLEIRNVEGNYPSLEEALVRGFGYLVSICALMLGFLWAAVDSDGLTWHDRMSGTFITTATTK